MKAVSSGMPSSTRTLSVTTPRRERTRAYEHRVENVVLDAKLGEEQGGAEEAPEYYFDMRCGFEVNGRSIRNPELVIFKNSTRTHRFRPIVSADLTLKGSAFDPGVGTVPVGEFLEGGHLGGETSYIVEQVLDLSKDGVDYAPYLMGRLYDDWPDVRR